MVPNFCFLKAVFSNESLLVPHQREVRVKRWKQPYGKECTGRGWKRDNSGIVARNISLITLSCNLRTLFTIILLDTMPTYRNDKIRNNYDYLYWVSFMQLHVILNNILHLEIIFIFRIGISWNYLSPPPKYECRRIFWQTLIYEIDILSEHGQWWRTTKFVLENCHFIMF